MTRNGRWSAGVLAALVVGLSGCLADTAGPLEGGPALDAADPLDALGISASGCRQNGALSLYALSEGSKAGPYEQADVRDAIGFSPGVVPSVRGMAAYAGPVWGNWHMTMGCESYTFNGEQRSNLLMGFVGMYVKAPEWDTSGAQHQWLVDGISFSDPDWSDTLSELTGSRVGIMDRSIVDWLAPNFFYMEYDEGHHGWFEIHSFADHYAFKEDENIRFWVQVPSDASGAPTTWEEAVQFRPLGLDIIDTATGGGHKMGGLAYLRHYHADGSLAHNGDERGLYEDGFDRAFRVGDFPELWFEEYWAHF